MVVGGEDSRTIHGFYGISTINPKYTPRPSPCIGLEEQMYHLYQAKYHPWQMFTMDKTEESTILTGDSHILICQGFQAITAHPLNTLSYNCNIIALVYILSSPLQHAHTHARTHACMHTHKGPLHPLWSTGVFYGKFYPPFLNFLVGILRRFVGEILLRRCSRKCR